MLKQIPDSSLPDCALLSSFTRKPICIAYHFVCSAITFVFAVVLCACDGLSTLRWVAVGVYVGHDWYSVLLSARADVCQLLSEHVLIELIQARFLPPSVAVCTASRVRNERRS